MSIRNWVGRLFGGPLGSGDHVARPDSHRFEFIAPDGAGERLVLDLDAGGGLTIDIDHPGRREPVCYPLMADVWLNPAAVQRLRAWFAALPDEVAS